MGRSQTSLEVPTTAASLSCKRTKSHPLFPARALEAALMFFDRPGRGVMLLPVTRSHALNPCFTGISRVFRFGVTLTGNKTMQSPEQTPQQRRHGFQPGKSGNPRGRLSNAAKQERVEATARELAAEFGGYDALSPVDRVLITHAAMLVLRTPRSAEDVVRVANAVQRILGGLGKRKRKHEPEERPLQRYLRDRAVAAGSDGEAGP
jgi:hypothetical protein